jgi:hypothetical protein
VLNDIGRMVISVFYTATAFVGKVRLFDKNRELNCSEISWSRFTYGTNIILMYFLFDKFIANCGIFTKHAYSYITEWSSFFC